MNRTDAQEKAISTTRTNVVCAAGPGSGKSTVVVERIKKIVGPSAFWADKIAALSFTNAASRVLQERLDGLELGANSTLHAFALRTLRTHGAKYGYGERTALISPDSAADLMASIAERLNSKTALEKLLKLKAEKGRPARGKRLTADETIIATYCDELKEAGVVDYDVLLQELHRMLTEDGPDALSAQQSLAGAYEYLFVDESQDSNPLQWAIYRALPIPNKFFTGDPDQNLYEWNGARVKEMVDESKAEGTETILLEENFRSVPEICAAAQRLISKNVNRIDKATKPTRGDELVVQVSGPHGFESDGGEVDGVAKTIQELFKKGTPIAEIAVLCRTNEIASGFRRALPAMGIPVVEQDQKKLPFDWAYARSLIELHMNPENDSLAYFYLVAYALQKGQSAPEARKGAAKIKTDANAKGLSINAHLLKMNPITKPESALAVLTGAGVSRESRMIAAEKYRELPAGATMEEFVCALATASDYAVESGEGVYVGTAHSAKGREFDAVLIPGCEDQAYPGRDAEEESRRILFVAITRARKHVSFSHAKSRKTKWGEIVQRTQSRFLKEIFP